MRCHNLIGAAAAGIKNAWNYLTVSQGCSPNILSLTASIVLLLALTVSFYYRNLRRGPASPDSTKKPSLQFLPELNSFPYEPFIFLLYSSASWIGHAGLSVLKAVADSDIRAKMWQEMDIFSGTGTDTLFWVGYFVFLEGVEMLVTHKYVMKRYLAEKKNSGSTMLPLAEKTVVPEPIQEKEVSIYEAIAEPPTPTESESLLVDTESNTIIAPRPTLWQRFRSRCARNPPVLTAESVLGRYYMLAFFKCNLIFSFAMLSNRAACSLNPEQYFDGKVDQFPLVLGGCILWTLSSGRLLVKGMKFARAELKERESIAL